MPIREATCEHVAPVLFLDRFGGGAPLVVELIETSMAEVGDVNINLKACRRVIESKTNKVVECAFEQSLLDIVNKASVTCIQEKWPRLCSNRVVVITLSNESADTVKSPLVTMSHSRVKE